MAALVDNATRSFSRPLLGGTTNARMANVLANEDVLSTAINSLVFQLQKRPVDLGATLMTCSKVGAMVNRCIFDAPDPSSWSCSSSLSQALPQLMWFLVYAHNQSDIHLRAIETHVVGLCFVVVVSARCGAVFPHVQEVLLINFSFLLHAARVQLEAINSGRVLVNGVLPSVFTFGRIPTMSTAGAATSLSEHDDYFWLVVSVMAKIDEQEITRWFANLCQEANGEPFTVMLFRVIVDVATRYALLQCRACIPILENLRSGSLEAAVFPFPALSTKLVSRSPRRPLVFPVEPRFVIGQLLHVALGCGERLRAIDSSTWATVLRLFALLSIQRLTVAVAGGASTAETNLPSTTSLERLSSGQLNVDMTPKSSALHEEATLFQFGEWMLKVIPQVAVPGASVQLVNCAVLTIARIGLVESHGGVEPPSGRALCRQMLDVVAKARCLPDMEHCIAMVLGEVCLVRDQCGAAFTACHPLHPGIVAVRDFLIDVQSVAMPKERWAGVAAPNTQEVKNWKSAVQFAATLAEAEVPDDDPTDSLWQLAVCYLKLHSRLVAKNAVDADVAYLPPPIRGAQEVCGMEVGWEGYDEWDAVATTEREALHFDASVATAMRLFNALLQRSLEHGDFGSAAAFCDAFASLLSDLPVSGVVCSSLLAAASCLYDRAAMGSDALRVGLQAQQMMLSLTCDLRSFSTLRDQLVESAKRL